jgi:hypothetical protein
MDSMHRNIKQTILSFLEHHWPLPLLTAFILVLHRDLLLWAVPATGDHPIHLAKGWLMSEHLLPTGRVTGWSHMVFSGYPAGTYYPVLGDLLVSLSHALGLGLLSWERSYTLMFLFLLVFMNATVYFVARRFVGPVGALAAALLALGDVGGWPQGGHYSTVHWAVWPFMLGLSLSWLSVLACESVMSKPIHKAPLPFLGLSVLLGLTGLAHPMTAFFLGISAPIFTVFFALWKRREIVLGRSLSRAVLAAVIGLVLAGFWLVPWLTTGDEWTYGWPAVGFGGAWLTADEKPYTLWGMTKDLFTNELFKNFFWLAWGLGLLGVAFGIASKKMWPTYLAVLLIVSFVFTGVCNTLGDGTIFRKVQIERMAAFLKFAWFVLAGYAVDRLGYLLSLAMARLRQDHGLRKQWERHRSRLALGFGLAFFAAVVAFGWSGTYSKVAEIGRLGGPVWKNMRNAYAFLAAQEKGPLDRVLYHPGMLCLEGRVSREDCNEVYHRHIFASSSIYTGLPRLKFGYEATAIYKNLPMQQRWPADAFLLRRMVMEPDALRNLHVRWIVSLDKWPDLPWIHEVRTFEDITVYSVDFGKEPPVRLDGPGKLTVLDWQDEKVVVRVEGSGEDSRIRYPISYYYPWHAYQDGKSAPIERHTVLSNVRDVLMTVKAKDGVTELLYERPLQERIARSASVVAWMGVVLAFLALMGIALVRRRVRRAAA